MKEEVIQRTIKVRIIKEYGNKVTIQMASSHGKMSMLKSEFEKRLQDGKYEVVV